MAVRQKMVWPMSAMTGTWDENPKRRSELRIAAKQSNFDEPTNLLSADTSNYVPLSHALVDAQEPAKRDAGVGPSSAGAATGSLLLQNQTLGNVGATVDAVGDAVGPALKNFAQPVAKQGQALANVEKATVLANQAQRAAGSGKSAVRSQRAGKLALELNAAKNELRQAKTVVQRSKALMRFGRLAHVAENALGPLGFAAVFLSKAMTSPTTTVPGRLVDAGATASLDTAFGSAFPVTAAIDAAAGLVGDLTGQKWIGKNNISSHLSDSVSSTVASGESILTGDTTAMGRFHDESLSGEHAKVFQLAAEAGEFWAKEGAERVETVGNFYGGADSVSGRAAAFVSAVPGVGHLGEGIGWAGAQAVLGAETAVDKVEEAASAIDAFLMPDGYTLNPFEW
jgi:hypothetical protein